MCFQVDAGIKCNCRLNPVEAFSSKWQGNFSTDSNGHYKIIRQELNVSLKASLKSVIAETDSFGTVEGSIAAAGSCRSPDCMRVVAALRRREYDRTKNPFNLGKKSEQRLEQKKKDPRITVHLRHFKFPQKLRVTKEDGWRTEILDLFIHRSGLETLLWKVWGKIYQKTERTLAILKSMLLCG